MSRASLQRRLFVGALIWIVLALIATGVLLSVLFRQHLEAELARRLDADFLQLISQFEVDADGRLRHPVAMSDPLYQRVFSGRYWSVAQGDDTPLRSRSLWDQSLAVDPAGDERQRLTGPRGEPLLAVVRQITLPGIDTPLRLSVAASLRPVETAVRNFRRSLAIALGVLALGLGIAAALQVKLGLWPLQRLRRELGAIREGRADRLSGDYPAEVSALVDDLNSVLVHNATLIERARRQAGNLAHALKTPLSVIGNEAARMAGRGSDDGRADERARAERLQQEVAAMQQHIDWHLARTRIAGRRRAGQATPVAPVLERLQRTLQRLYGERGIVIDTDLEHDPVFAGEARDLEQMLGNLLENACKWARGVIAVRAEPGGGRLLITVADDGPGLNAVERAQAAGAGQRFDEAVPGSGLGLAIVSDLAEAYEGDLVLARAELGGLSARLQLPGGQSASA
jgi:signal transduction histidine kinase